MSSSARLKYRIVKCTSEDPEFPASELLTHSSQTKGWQTARFCDFPQEIGLQFETPVHLRQVQFLSHQSKIATKIELFTALSQAGQPASYDTINFKRLGYLSLDSNERSQFQARELKSVYVDVSAQFVRIVLHKCHVNRYNIVNQVGLIALNCLGEALGPDLAIGPPAPNPVLQRGPPAGPVAAYPQQQQQQQPPAQAAAPLAQAQTAAEPQPTQQDAGQAASDEMQYDAQTLERIKALSRAKARAVEAEDYEEAKRCKEMLARLRQTGLLLRELEDRKRAAVRNEDYDAAKALKVEIDRLRSAIERPEQPPPQQLSRGNGSNGPAPGTGRPPSGGSQGSGRGPAAGGTEWAGHGGSAPRGGHQPHMTPSPIPFASSPSPEPDFGRPHSGGKSSPSPSMGGASKPPPPKAFQPPVEEDDFQSEAPSRREQQQQPLSPPLPANGGARVARTPPLGSSRGGAPPPAPAASELPPEYAPVSEKGGGSDFDAANHPLSGVPNVEDLNKPEALHGNFVKEADPLIAVFGEYVTQCVYSKTWNLRDAALQKLMLDLQDGVRSEMDPNQLFTAYIQVLKRMIPDKNVQVCLSAGSLLQAVSSQLISSPLRRPDVQSALDSLMPLLVERLGDSNARVDHVVRDAYSDLMRNATVGTAFTAQYVLKPPKKKSVNPRVYVARLQLLTAMVSEAGVQPDSKEGLPLEPAVQLAMEWFNQRDAEVRESAVKLVGACYAHAGLPRIEKHLANLRQAQREIFDEEFERVDSGEGLGAGNDDGLGALPPPQKPPARSAAASNRSTPKNSGGTPRAGAPGGTIPEEEDDADWVEDPSHCSFCGWQNPSNAKETMIWHLYSECPRLTPCKYCEQVIGIHELATHWTECEKATDEVKGAAQDMALDCCPLCSTNVGGTEEQHFHHHLIDVGCECNPRDKFRQVLQQQAK